MPPSFLSFRTLILLCLVSIAWAFSFGLGAPLASLWLRDAGWSDTVIGLNTGVYYSGIALAACFVPAGMRRWGRGCPIAGMIISGLTVAWFPWGGSIGPWFALRLLNGFAGALSLIPLETYVNRHSTTEQRSRNFGFYAFAIAFGWALGNLIGLQMYEALPYWAFAVGGTGGVIAALVCWGLPWPGEPVEPVQTKTPLSLGRNFLSFGSAWTQGFLEGGMVAFLSIYLLSLGLAEVRVSWLTSGIMIGVILFQVAVAWLADRLGRTPVLLACYGAAGTGLACLPFCNDSVWLISWLFLVGACSGAFYPLGLALLGDRLPEAALSRASAWYLGINCIGSLVGPGITGAIMDYFGKAAMFMAAEAALVSVLICWGPIHIYNRRSLHHSGDKSIRISSLETRRAA
jgi:MFS family permease